MLAQARGIIACDRSKRQSQNHLIPFAPLFRSKKRRTYSWKTDRPMNINENEIIRQFHFYLQELNVQDATETTFADCINEDLSEDEIESVSQTIIVPEIAVQFATKFL
jgi:hypothetical protein